MRKHHLRLLTLACALSILVSGCQNTTMPASPTQDVIKDNPEQGAATSSISALFAGDHSSFGLTESGELYAWGFNDEGSLGLDTEEDVVESPTKVLIPEKVIDVAPGTFSVALTESGTIYTWGVDNFGFEGDGRTYQAKPHKILMPEKIVQIFNGHGAVGLAKGESGALYIWGWNMQGLFGDGTTQNSMVPQKVELPSEVVDVSCYDTHVVALCEDGKVYAWGSNYYGELGDGAVIENPSPSGELVENNKLFPQEVVLDGTIVSVAAARGASYALTNDGKVYAWGANDVGQLGVGNQELKYSSSPVEVPLQGRVKAIEVGAFHAFALMDNGDLYGWGYNSRKDSSLSILGIGNNELIIYSPTVVPIDGKIKDVNTGGGHTFAWTESGEMLAWGSNESNKISKDFSETVNQSTLFNLKIK